MSANEMQRRRKIPWWAYLACMDDESLAWNYDLYELCGSNLWPEEFDESVSEGRFAASEGQRGSDTSKPAEADGWLRTALRAIASRFRRAGAEQAAPLRGGEGGLALPAGRP